jgi:UDP-N-acetylmuramoyl-tripeptide--D-alanyl-D-alanine ligase
MVMNIINIYSHYWRYTLYGLQLTRYRLADYWHWLFSRRRLNMKHAFVYRKTKKIKILIGLWWLQGVVVTSTMPWYLTSLYALIPACGWTLGIAWLWPYEYYNHAHTVRAIQKKLKMLDVPVLAIAGSYGKTSLKHCLTHLLNTPSFPVIATPLSYNTVFGIAKFVRLALTKHHALCLIELGEQRSGDIQALCRMVQPKIGILTGLNEQHLQHFGSLEETARTLLELADSMPTGSVIWFNQQDKRLLHTIQTVHSLHQWQPYPALQAENVTFTAAGSSWTWRHQDKTYAITTQLLGWGHVHNVCAAATIALDFGASMADIVTKIHSMPCIPARFQQMTVPSGALYINNGYNSSPNGFLCAIDTLKAMHYAHKILITPGLVELGSAADTVHHMLKKALKNVFHKIYLVGTLPQLSILESLPNTQRVATLEPALSDSLALGANTVVLVENDRPVHH